MRWMKGCLDAVSDASTLSHKFAFEWLIIAHKITLKLRVVENWKNKFNVKKTDICELEKKNI